MRRNACWRDCGVVVPLFASAALEHTIEQAIYNLSRATDPSMTIQLWHWFKYLQCKDQCQFTQAREGGHFAGFQPVISVDRACILPVNWYKTFVDRCCLPTHKRHGASVHVKVVCTDMCPALPWSQFTCALAQWFLFLLIKYNIINNLMAIPFGMYVLYNLICYVHHGYLNITKILFSFQIIIFVLLLWNCSP